MGADIYEEFRAAKDVIDEADEAVGGGLKQLMFKGPQDVLTSTENAQPAILSHSIALLRVLESEFGFDVKSCTFALGHSLGEYSALVATRSLSLADAIQLVRLRGNSMKESVDSKETSMKALLINGAHLEEIEALMQKVQRSLPNGEVAEIANLNKYVSRMLPRLDGLSGVNGTYAQLVLSGTSRGVEYACSIIQTKGYTGRALSLPVSAPFHCRLMQPAAEKMLPALNQTSFKEPVIEVVSNVTGKPFESAKEIPQLLYQQITKTVQWQRSLRFAKDDGVHDWVVIGPNRVLANICRKEYPRDIIMAIATAADIKEHGPQLSAPGSTRS
ncbi:hypothetical protein HK104_005100 [Borealophlyctis nickersoniae]|nr:hypothetical protein HK104_005100 [Borealophlyctis nickersoniae]